MIGYPSNVLVVADYPHQRFDVQFRKKVDFILSCGNVEFSVLEEIHGQFGKPIFAVKGNLDTSKPFPGFVQNVHLQLVQHRHWLIGGFGGVSALKDSGPDDWEGLAAGKLAKFPYVDIFICHAPLLKPAGREDCAYEECQAVRRYIEERQPKFVYHGCVQEKLGAMAGETAVVSVYGAEIFSLTYQS
jgi:Icc-related predicted phosphoesterase